MFPVFLVGIFYAGIFSGFLPKQPGPWYIEHANAVLLLLIPAFHPLVVVLYALGIALWIDDALLNHLPMRWWPNHRSWVHREFWWYSAKIQHWLRLGPDPAE